jgi:two-component sensor histidine kinase
MALSATHNVLTQASWEAAGIQQLLAQELAPYPSEQVAFSGPAVYLPARQALALGMVLHELTTNATKYGALSQPGGRLAVDWQTFDIGRAEPLLVLEWRESGGPPVKPPTASGFGSRLISMSVEQDLSGSVASEYAETGYVCRIEAPLPPIGHTQVMEEEGSSARQTL